MGVRKRGRIYYFRYTDAEGKRREDKGTTGRRETEELLAAAVSRAARVRAGLSDGSEEAIASQGRRPLAAHIEEWAAAMAARDVTVKHARQYRERVGRLAAVLRGGEPASLSRRGVTADIAKDAALDQAAKLASARLSDLSPGKIQEALGKLRAAGMAAQTLNHYRRAMSAFCEWAVGDGRLRSNPLDRVSGYNADADRRTTRRNLEPGEVAALVAAAEAGPERLGMAGEVRAWAYRLAAITGFRAGELASLTRDSFDLTLDAPVIRLEARHAKDGRQAVQPIPAAYAAPLAAWLSGRPAGPTLPLHPKVAEAMAADLKAAGIAYRTREGVADFHSLRGYYVTALVRSCPNIKVVQRLARHARPETTLKHYARATEGDLRAAVAATPLAPLLPRAPHPQCTPVAASEPERPSGAATETPEPEGVERQ